MAQAAPYEGVGLERDRETRAGRRAGATDHDNARDHVPVRCLDYARLLHVSLDTAADLIERVEECGGRNALYRHLEHHGEP